MRVFTFFILIYTLGVHPVFSQDSTDSLPKLPTKDFRSRKNRAFSTVYKTNPLPILWGPIPLTSEFRFINESVVTSNQSIWVGFSYLGKSLLFAMLEDSISQATQQPKSKIKGFRVQAAYRFYLNNGKFAPRGFYISPHYSYSKARFSDKQLNRLGIYARISNFNLNVLAGFQLVARSGFTLDFYTGLGYKKYKWVEYYPPQKIVTKDVSELGDIYAFPINFTLGFNLGLAF